MIAQNQTRALSPRIAYRVFVALTDLREAIVDAYGRRQTRVALSRLTDHELADIGMSRDMISNI